VEVWLLNRVTRDVEICSTVLLGGLGRAGREINLLLVAVVEAQREAVAAAMERAGDGHVEDK